MVSLRRFGPLMLLALICLGALLARSFQVQVLEHDLWAREAANLGRSWSIEPYQRGTIYDRKHRPIVRDEEVYELEFVWREFRRGHPLGQVAEARSLLCLLPISLEETLLNLEPWARELGRLSPEAIDDFGRGASISTGTLVVPASSESEQEQRRARRADLHFYVRALLGVDRECARALRDAVGTADWKLSYVELVAHATDRSPEEVEQDLERRAADSVADLRRLSALFDASAGPGGALGLTDLIGRIEGARRSVDDAAADDLFERATGFEAWRLDERNLARIDLEWMRQSLFWDRARLAEWVHSRGTEFDDLVERHLAGLTIARFKVGTEEPATRVLNSLASLFRSDGRREAVLASAPARWDEVEALAVLDEMPDLFEGTDLPGSAAIGPVLPFQDAGLRAAGLEGAALVDAVIAGAGEAKDFDLFAFDDHRRVTRAAGMLYDAACSDHPVWNATQARAVEAVLRSWNSQLQGVIRTLLEEALARSTRAAAPPRSLRLAEGRLKAALEERDYVVRDRGARPTALLREPTYDLVRLVTRFPDRFAGFGIQTVARRVPLALDEEADPLLLAETLIGQVHSPFLVDVLSQEQHREELQDLSTRVERSEEEERYLVELAGKSLRVGELQGGTGIEGYFDALLAGRNGYRETQGLEERSRSGEPALFEPAVDGLDLVLTLDLDLQRNAQRVLEHPAPPPADESSPDEEWTRHPVGAIVLLTPEGDVLAAASVPSRPGAEVGEFQDGERENVIDRTMRVPRMQPPGSVFKPFVAAWAMQFLGLDPDRALVSCLPEKPGELPCWGHMHCHAPSGHSVLPFAPLVDLRTALRRSCNVYFACLGDQCFEGDDFRRMVSAFGFGQPTGVRSMLSGREGPGLREDGDLERPLAVPGEPLQEVHRQRLANGLVYLSASPMQVARAYAALATGKLPDLRIIAGLEALQRPRTSVPLPIDARVLGFLRDTLVEVVEKPGSSAYGKRLDRASLGFSVALKTGSADYRGGMVPHYPHPPSDPSPIEWESGTRKHTWIAGWCPARDPKLVFVVYVHDTATTSNHGAVYLAGQLLHSDEVRAYLAAQGVTLEEPSR